MLLQQWKFFATNYPQGIQIVQNNTVVVESDSLSDCDSITQGKVIFSCGEKKRKLGKDTLYELCLSEVVAPIERG